MNRIELEELKNKLKSTTSKFFCRIIGSEINYCKMSGCRFFPCWHIGG